MKDDAMSLTKTEMLKMFWYSKPTMTAIENILKTI